VSTIRDRAVFRRIQFILILIFLLRHRLSDDADVFRDDSDSRRNPLDKAISISTVVLPDEQMKSAAMKSPQSFSVSAALNCKVGRVGRLPTKRATERNYLELSEEDQKWGKSDNGLDSINTAVLLNNHTDSFQLTQKNEALQKEIIALKHSVHVLTEENQNLKRVGTENTVLKERLRVLKEEMKNLKKEKIALERRSQDITHDLESVLKKARTIDVIDE
jgi:hypothetical protein